MAKVTSKLQVTLPKALAERFGIKAGDHIDWEAAGEVIRVVPPSKRQKRGSDLPVRLGLFDQATARQRKRQAQRGGAGPKAPAGTLRGWTRGELYRRGGSR
jgi:AbrB family looped-hinge helix DNA binding protein